MRLLERDAFLASLTACADDARRGDGRLVLVAGEAGVLATTGVPSRGLAEAHRLGLVDLPAPRRPQDGEAEGTA